MKQNLKLNREFSLLENAESYAIMYRIHKELAKVYLAILILFLFNVGFSAFIFALVLRLMD